MIRLPFSPEVLELLIEDRVAKCLEELESLIE
jgi:hypothetical protein